VRRFFKPFAFFLLLAALPGAAMADWPAKPVKVVVPFAAGGTTDVVARVLGQKLGERWNQSVVIENRVGAGGNIGAEAVARAPADGYTLLMASGSVLTVNPHLYKRLPFDAQRDFAPITNVATGPMLLVVSPSLPVDNLKSLIALARARPGSLNFGSAGVGSQVHMAGENLANAAGIDIVHVPYKGEALGFNDLVAGNIQLMVGNIAAAAPLVTAGKLKALAVTGRERSRLLPNVPTAAEAGLTGFDNAGWFGLVAPAGLAPEIIVRIQRDVAAALDSPEMRARLFVQGMTPVANSPAEFTRAINAEAGRWARVVGDRKLAAN
jgi:tripartite-type tricarboxylate transporter receptor subunit TctC